MKLNLNFVTKTTRLGQDNEIIFFKSKKTKSKYLNIIKDNIFSNKLFLEENFIRRDYNDKSFVLVNCTKCKVSLDYEKIGSNLYKFLSDNKIENSFINANSNSLTNIELEKTLHGAQLKSYDFNFYKSDKSKAFQTNLNVVGNNIKKTNYLRIKLKALLDGVFLTRDLVSEPSNNLTPLLLSKEAIKLRKTGLKVEQLDEKKLKQLKMGALLGVAQGSANKPYVVTLEWRGNKSKKTMAYTFVGKGVTFDTGGISIKPSGGMEEMKYDMGGSAVVLGLMKALALRKTKANVSGVIGLVENMPSGTAQRPGDVVKSMSGQTIEVINTDAEGRLVLADILCYAQQKFQPKKIIDLATLTGAIIVSIGQEKAGMFSNNKDFADELTELGLKVGEEVWNMPVDDSYEKDIRSDIADMKNVGSGRGAGSTAGAIFLKRFIKNTIWMHLDIAGVTWAKSDRPMTPKGGSGFGVRLLDELVFKSFK